MQALSPSASLGGGAPCRGGVCSAGSAGLQRARGAFREEGPLVQHLRSRRGGMGPWAPSQDGSAPLRSAGRGSPLRTRESHRVFLLCSLVHPAICC